MRLAVLDFNASQKPKWRVNVRSYNDEESPARAKEIAQKISLNPHVFAVIGNLTSGCSIAASRIYASSGIPMLTPSSGNSTLTSQQELPDWKWPRVVFRLPPPDLYQANYAANFAYSRINLRSFWVVGDGSAYGMELSQSFGDDFKKLGGNVMGYSEFPQSSSDFSELIGNIEKSNAQGVFFGGYYPEAARILLALQKAGIKPVFFSGGASKANNLFDLAGSAVDKAYFVVNGVPIDFLPSAKQFVSAYKKLYNAIPRTYDVYAYEATKIALEALSNSAPLDLLPNREKILAKLQETNQNSMIGIIQFDGKGDDLNTLVTLVQAHFRKRKFEPIY